MSGLAITAHIQRKTHSRRLESSLNLKGVKLNMLIKMFYNFIDFIVFVVQSLAISFCILVVVGCIINKYRANRVVLVDFDSLVDIEPIKQREAIWYKNHPEDMKDCLKYMVAHISEQTVIGNQILKCRFWQGMGYKMIYVSNRHERLRIPTARVLNEWGLKGELYCSGDEYCKECEMKYLSKKYKIAGIITTEDEDGRKFAEIMLGSKRL